MKQFIFCAWVCALLSLSGLPAVLPAQTYWDGSSDTEWEGQGTAESPYLIT